MSVPFENRALTPEEATGFRSLFEDLKRSKPQGWSVVWGDRQIIVRPEDRELGKFSLTPSTSEQVYVCFFGRPENSWTAAEHFPASGSATSILTWMKDRLSPAPTPDNEKARGL